MAVNLDELPLPDLLPAIPDGWRYESLGDLVDERGVSYGIVQPGSETTDGVPIVRVNNIRNGRIDTSDMLKVEAGIEAKFQRSRLRGGEVLLTLVGTLGEVAIVPDNLRGWNVARAVGVIPVRKDPGSLWVSICLRSAFIQHCIRTWATTTVQATFNLRDLVKLPIPIPPTDTREAIAHILGTLDDKIELNRRMNATLEAMARALFQSWFVDFDPVRAKLDGRLPAGLDKATAALFPVHLQDASFGKVPGGWAFAKLDECMDKIIDYRGKTPTKTSSGVPLVTAKVVKNGRITGFDEFIALQDYDSWMRRGIPKPGDVLITTEAPLGEIAQLDDRKVALAQRLIALRGKHGVMDNDYLKLLMQSDFIQEQLLARASGTTVTGIKQSELRQLHLLVPNFEVQKAFSNRIQPMRKLMQENELMSSNLATLRDTLLPKLLSGELSVSSNEVARRLNDA